MVNDHIVAGEFRGGELEGGTFHLSGVQSPEPGNFLGDGQFGVSEKPKRPSNPDPVTEIVNDPSVATSPESEVDDPAM